MVKSALWSVAVPVAVLALTSAVPGLQAAGTISDDAFVVSPAPRAQGGAVAGNVAALARSTPNALPYSNGPLITNPGGGFGGADASAVQTALSMSTYGFGNQLSAGNRVADDFTVTDAGGWQIDTVTFYGYQTGSTTTSTFTAVYLQIWNGRPDDPGSSVVWGDLTTNRMTATAWSNMYRVLDTDLTNTQRPVMTITAAVNTDLAAGTYWLDWMVDGTGGSGPWAPPITILGQTTTGNARQYTGTWADLLDTGISTAQGLPFEIEGTLIQPTPTPTPTVEPTVEPTATPTATPAPAPGLVGVTSSTSPSVGDRFTLDAVCSPIDVAFDAYGVVLSPTCGTESFTPSNPTVLRPGVQPLAVSVPGLAAPWQGTLYLEPSLRPFRQGNTYIFIIGLVPAGQPPTEANVIPGYLWQGQITVQ